jgi:hypothetical protein
MLEFTGLCTGCDQWTTLDDVGLCDPCAAKFDRDLIRQRAWDYSATAIACHPKDYEALRQAVIEQYSPAYELLVPPEAQPPAPSVRRVNANAVIENGRSSHQGQMAPMNDEIEGAYSQLRRQRTWHR